MKLLLVSSEFPPGPGGIGTHAYQLASNLSDLGHIVQVLCPQDYAAEDEINNFNKSLPFSIIRIADEKSKLSKGLNRLKLMTDCLRQFKPDIVLSSGLWSIRLGALVKIFYQRVPWLIVGHGTEFGKSEGLKAFITRSASNKADEIICVSDYTKQAVQNLGVNRPTIDVVHNGADAQQFRILDPDQVKQFRDSLGVNDKFVLLTVGNVSSRKGQEVVIRALPEILDRFQQVVYWMAGLPSMQPELEHLAKELGVEKNIRFFGRISMQTLLELYNSCDLFVMTSRQLDDGDFEGYGIAVIEAALCGKSAVVSNNSGLSEAVIDGQTGLLVNQNDPKETAEAIIGLVNEPERLQQLSMKAQKRALETQTWDKVAASYFAVMQKHIDDAGNR